VLGYRQSKSGAWLGCVCAGWWLRSDSRVFRAHAVGWVVDYPEQQTPGGPPRVCPMSGLAEFSLGAALCPLPPVAETRLGLCDFEQIFLDHAL
jgi:hypothetical protein